MIHCYLFRCITKRLETIKINSFITQSTERERQNMITTTILNCAETNEDWQDLSKQTTISSLTFHQNACAEFITPRPIPIATDSYFAVFHSIVCDPHRSLTRVNIVPAWKQKKKTKRSLNRRAIKRCQIRHMFFFRESRWINTSVPALQKMFARRRSADRSKPRKCNDDHATRAHTSSLLRFTAKPSLPVECGEPTARDCKKQKLNRQQLRLLRW